MNRTKNIFLIGPPGVGKSTIGRQLTSLIKAQFFDSDQEIEKRCGADIAWIFDLEGEEGFRDREAKVIDELTEKQGIVLATGGGTILRGENRDRLSARGVVIYLQADPDQLFQRTEKDKKRPLLQGGDKKEKLEKITDERDPLYREAADYVIETKGRTAKNIANEIIDMIYADSNC